MRPLLAAALLALPLAAASAQAPPSSSVIPPRPTRWVTDQAGFLSPGVRQSLDGRLEAWERTTGHSFIVWIGPTSGDFGPEDFATKAFEAWGVGQKGKDEGLALFVFSEDRKVRFEVGYGLEGTLPDALASRIIREQLLPRLATGDRDGAVTAAVDGAMRVVSGDSSALAPAPTSAPQRRAPARKLTTGELVIAGIVGLLFLILLVTNPRLAFWLLLNIVSSSGRRGSGGGGGGWSGGGGRSGGGGATGSW